MNTAISDRSASPWIVLKFGGTSVSSKARWEAIAEQARKRKSEGLKTLIVVSAVSGVTNALQAAADPASAADLPALTLAGLVDRHRALSAELGLDFEAVLGARLTELRTLVDEAGQGLRDLPWQARWLAQGELLSSTLGAAYLAREVPGCRWLDSREYLRARETPNQSERGRWLSVACDPPHDAALAVRLAGEADVFITQGFMAGDDSGATRILGRGGSDTSAACFGALLGARCVEIWTDVPGMFSANPRQVPDARLLRRLDFEEAQEIATTGAKVLHPRCIDPCRRAQVPMAIRWTERPDSERTEIGFEAVAARSSIKAISLRAGTTLIAMESIGMWQQVGFLADVFAEFKRHGLSVDLIGSSETNVTVSLDATENLLDAETVEALARDLARVCRVKVIAPCAVITLVGRGMRAMLHRLVQTLGELGQTKVHLISQSSNDLNLSIVVDEAAGESLVPLLHQTLEHSGVMATDDARLFGPSWRDLHATPGSVAPPRWWRQRAPELSTLAAQGTPRYVYSLGEVRAAAAALRALRGVDRWYYACKANEHPALLRALVQAGFGLECVSIAEIEHALASVPGLLASSLLFTPNFAARSEYAAALALGVRLTVDNLHPLREWQELWKGREIMLRVDPGIGRGHHDKVRTGGARSKFGIGVADLSTAIELAKSAGAEVIGLHAHAGSGIEQAGHWAQLLAELASLAERHGAIRILDLGGGMGVHGGLDLAAMDAAIGHARALYPQFEIWMEPGRWPVAQAGVLLATVTQLKEKEGVRFLGIDAGMHTLIRPALYDARHPVHNLTRLGEPAIAPVQVVGPICESGDVIAADCALPASREGDLILIDEAGAYGAVMASNYNRRPKPQESVLDE